MAAVAVAVFPELRFAFCKPVFSGTFSPHVRTFWFPPCPLFLLSSYAFSRKVVPVFAKPKPTFIVGMRVMNRADLAPEVQSIITRYGQDIIGRFGIPSSDKNSGLIVLLMQEAAAVGRLTAELQEVAELEVKTVAFE